MCGGGGQVYARMASDGLMTWGFPGTWAQFQVGLFGMGMGAALVLAVAMLGGIPLTR